MRRYWLPKESFLPSGEILISGDSFHHITRVCRQGVGDRFEVLHEGQAHLVEIVTLEKKKALALPLESRKLPELPHPHIHLALSLPRFSTLEKVIEKSVELGVASLNLFSSDFSFMKPKEKELVKKEERWQKIILGATQQTGRGDLMGLTSIRPLSVLLDEVAQAPGSVPFLAYEGEGTRPLAQALELEMTEKARDIWLFVGGEGGFSAQDLSLFRDYGILPLGLGEQVLRVETACVALLSILKYDLGHFG